MEPFLACSSTNNSIKSRSGQALVELGLLFVLIVFLVVAVVDFARLFHAQITITNAAREGARYAILELNLQDGLEPINLIDPNNETVLIRQKVVEEAATSDILIDPTRVAVSCPGDVCMGGVPLSVGVEYDFDVLVSFWISDHLTLRRQIEMLIP